MPEYLVTWEVDVTAPDARQAAMVARMMQRDPKSTATVFTVANKEADVMVEVDQTRGTVRPVGVPYTGTGSVAAPFVAGGRS